MTLAINTSSTHIHLFLEKHVLFKTSLFSKVPYTEINSVTFIELLPQIVFHLPLSKLKKIAPGFFNLLDIPECNKRLILTVKNTMDISLSSFLISLYFDLLEVRNRLGTYPSPYVYTLVDILEKWFITYCDFSVIDNAIFFNTKLLFLQYLTKKLPALHSNNTYSLCRKKIILLKVGNLHRFIPTKIDPIFPPITKIIVTLKNIQANHPDFLSTILAPILNEFNSRMEAFTNTSDYEAATLGTHHLTPIYLHIQDEIIPTNLPLNTVYIKEEKNPPQVVFKRMPDFFHNLREEDIVSGIITSLLGSTHSVCQGLIEIDMCGIRNTEEEKIAIAKPYIPGLFTLQMLLQYLKGEPNFDLQPVLKLLINSNDDIALKTFVTLLLNFGDLHSNNIFIRPIIPAKLETRVREYDSATLIFDGTKLSLGQLIILYIHGKITEQTSICIKEKNCNFYKTKTLVKFKRLCRFLKELKLEIILLDKDLCLGGSNHFIRYQLINNYEAPHKYTLLPFRNHLLTLPTANEELSKDALDEIKKLLHKIEDPCWLFNQHLFPWTALEPDEKEDVISYIFDFLAKDNSLNRSYFMKALSEGEKILHYQKLILRYFIERLFNDEFFWKLCPSLVNLFESKPFDEQAELKKAILVGMLPKLNAFQLIALRERQNKCLVYLSTYESLVELLENSSTEEKAIFLNELLSSKFIPWSIKEKEEFLVRNEINFKSLNETTIINILEDLKNIMTPTLFKMTGIMYPHFPNMLEVARLWVKCLHKVPPKKTLIEAVKSLGNYTIPNESLFCIPKTKMTEEEHQLLEKIKSIFEMAKAQLTDNDFFGEFSLEDSALPPDYSTKN